MRKRMAAIVLLLLAVVFALPTRALAIDTTTRDTEGYDGVGLPTGPEKSGNTWTVTPENAQYTLDGAYGSISGKTICFGGGQYSEVLVLGRVNKFSGSGTKYYSSDWTTESTYEELASNSANQYSRTVENVTFTAEEGVVLPGFTTSSGHKYGTTGSPSYDYVRETTTESTVNSYYAATILKNLTFDGLTFSGSVIINDYLKQADTNGITFTGCTFQGDADQMSTNGFCGIGMKADTKRFKNVTVKNCSITNYFQGIYVQGPEDWTIQNCTFNGTTHNAIALQSSGENPVNGMITLKENVIQNAGDRAVRLGNATDATIVLENNIMLDSGDSTGQLIKAGALTFTTVSLNYNYWGGEAVSTAVAGGLTQPTATGIHGGTFTEEIRAEYCAAGFVPDKLDDGTYGVKADTTFFASGTGTGADPFVIKSAAQLAAFRDSVNNGVTYAGQHIRLDANIDLSGDWTPIGTGARSGSGYTGNAFMGTFDGNGKTISGLTITGTGTYSGNKAIGLFGVVAGGTVRDLTLTGMTIDCSDNECAGGVAGLMVSDAAISGCKVSGSISIKDGAGGIVGRMLISGTVSDCVNNANVTCTAGGAAGIVGKAYYTQQNKTMTIENCTNNGSVSNDEYHAGGISALCAANVTGCTNNGTITAGNTAGGIVAEQINWGTVSGCTNTAQIKGDNNAGGIIGWVRYQTDMTSYAKSEKISVLNNTNSALITTKTDNKTAGGLGWGGIVGTVYNAAYIFGNENNAASITGGTFGAGIVGNLQENSGNLFYNGLDINVVNNVSTTPLESIKVDGSCRHEYAYNNKAGTFVVSGNSEAWVAEIGTQKYATLAAAIESAGNGDIITVIADITLADDTTFAISRPLHIIGAEVNGQKAAITVHYTGTASKGLFTFQTGSAGSGIENLKINITGEATGKRTYAVLFSNYAGTTPQTVIRGVDLVGDDSISSIGAQIGIASTGGTDGGNVLVTECTFKNFCYGVYIDNISNFVFEGNTIDGTKYNAVNVGENGGSNIEISGNTFKNISYANYDDPLYSSGISVGANASAVTIGGNDITMLNDKPAVYYVTNNQRVTATFRDGEVGVATVSGILGDGGTFAFTTPAAPTKPGYNFLGWSDDTTTYQAGKEVTISEDTTFTAVWSAIPAPSPTTYNVTVAEAENGKVTVDPTTAAEGDEVTVTATPAEGYEVASVAVTSGNRRLEVTDEGDGTYTFEMPAADVTVAVAFQAAAPAVDLPFTDVAGDAWYRGAVAFVYANRLMTGYEGTTLFGPEDDLGREQAAMVLFRALAGASQAPAPECGLADVDQAGWYARAVNWAVASGLVTGYDDGSGLFGVGDALTRDQFAAIIARVAKADLSKADPSALGAFSDGDEVAEWAVPAVSWAAQVGILEGSDDGNGGMELRSSAEITRGEMATMIQRAAEAGLLPTA